MGIAAFVEWGVELKLNLRLETSKSFEAQSAFPVWYRRGILHGRTGTQWPLAYLQLCSMFLR
jgi:hypothetical protein